MLTRQGFAAVAAGVAAIVVGRFFAVVELFVIGTAFVAAAVVAVVLVRVRRPRVAAVRWAHPSVLVAGDTGRVDLHLRHLGRMRSTPFELVETVQRAGSGAHVARLPISPLAVGASSSTGYQLPTSVRGIVELGPLRAEVRDPLGIARLSQEIVGVEEVTVAPRAHLLEIPQLGQGLLGTHLLERARRLGPGDFHGLREYVDGDEPRSIHWKASARSEQLLVKEHTVEGLRRCTVVLDADPDAYRDADGFERAIVAAASLIHSAEREGLTTRFVTAGGVDLRGPDVVVNTLRVLARLRPSASSPARLDREPGEGLGLLISITATHGTGAWRRAHGIVDPTITVVGVTTDERAGSGLNVSARSEGEFLDSWRQLTGRGRLDLVGA